MEREIAMKRAASFCAESERNVAEVERKLRKWGVDDDDIDSIIDRLKSDDFLNEERYCKAYINDRFRLNHWGKVKIRYELGKRDVDRQYIDAALADIDDDEDRKSTRLNSSHGSISYAVFCLKKKNKK